MKQSCIYSLCLSSSLSPFSLSPSLSPSPPFSLSLPVSPGTSSTNTVSGPGGQGPGPGSGGQNQGQPSPNPPQQGRKGTFTDDLHKLVDNWARDAISLSQGKSRSKHQQQPSQGHSYQVSKDRLFLV